MKWGCGFLLGIALVAGGLLAWWLAPVEVDDLDLVPDTPSLDGAQNGYHHLTNAIAALIWPTNNTSNLRDMAAGRQWNPQLASVLLKENREALRHLDRAAGTPWIWPGALSFTNRIPELGPLIKLSRIQSIEAQRWAMQGRPDRAMNSANQLVELGLHVAGGHGVLIHGLVGLALVEQGLSRLRSLARRPNLPAGLLRDQVEHMATWPDRLEPAMVNTLRRERLYTLNTMTNLPETVSFFTLFSGGSFDASFLRHIPHRLLVNPGRSRLRTAEVFREMEEDLARSYADSSIRTQQQLRVFSKQVLLSRNPVGELLVGLLVPAVGNVVERHHRTILSFAATRTLYALRLYREERQHLPPSLSELVPDYLPGLPVDPFDGRPLRYAPERGVVYSVGEDLVDGGGVEEDGDPWSMADPVFMLGL